MNVSDIKEQDGIWVINLTNDSGGKSVKTISGHRIVPNNPKLIDFGLLDYVEEIKSTGGIKLFPNLRLGNIGAKDAVPTLISLLQDQDETVRKDATKALRKIGTPEALKAVEE